MGLKGYDLFVAGDCEVQQDDFLKQLGEDIQESNTFCCCGNSKLKEVYQAILEVEEEARSKTVSDSDVCSSVSSLKTSEGMNIDYLNGVLEEISSLRNCDS